MEVNLRAIDEGRKIAQEGIEWQCPHAVEGREEEEENPFFLGNEATALGSGFTRG